jgi:hypothetical protein
VISKWQLQGLGFSEHGSFLLAAGSYNLILWNYSVVKRNFASDVTIISLGAGFGVSEHGIT